jgi:electron transport complex protein RnfG
MKPEYKTAFMAALLLGIFSVIGMGLVTLVYSGTAKRIANNQRQLLLHSLQELIPAALYDNNMLEDVVMLDAIQLGGKPIAVYRARRINQPVAAVFTPVTPDGYGGDIHLLVAVKADGALAGVRVLAHKETPGLGDWIEVTKSRWIFGFEGLSLNQPAERLWKVKRDGGAFDQFTGATVTPRAVVKAIKNTLLYFNTHSATLFSLPAQTNSR